MDSDKYSESPARAAWWVFLAAILLVYLRDYDLWLDPRFWAEEGSHGFVYAWHHGFWATVFKPLHRYYELSLTLGASLASLAPLEWAPLVTQSYAGVIQLLPVAVLLRAWRVGQRRGELPANAWPMALAALVIVFAPTTYESHLTTTSSQFFLSLCTALILSFPVQRQGAGGRFELVVLVLAGLSGPGSALLAPLFWLRWWRLEDDELARRARLLQAVVLSMALVLQSHLLVGHLWHQMRSFPLDPLSLLSIIWVKVFVVPLAGIRAGEYVGGSHLATLSDNAGLGMWPHFLALLLAVGSWIFILVRARSRTAVVLATSAVYMLGYSIFGAMGSKIAMVQPTFSARYSFGPVALLFLSLLVAGLQTRFPRDRWAAPVVVLVMVLISGSAYFNFPSWAISGVPWRAEVQKWREDSSYKLHIRPYDGWKIRLEPRRSVETE